jgi:hypothetical protein
MLNYRTQREGAYLSIEEQLDALWHELDTYGTISKTHTNSEGVEEDGLWYGLCKSVRTRFPKPVEE